MASKPQAAEGDLANQFSRGVDYLGALVDCFGETIANKSKQVSNCAYFGELSLKSPLCSLRRVLRAWGHLRGSEAGIQAGLQVASEPQAAEGDSANKLTQVVGLPMGNSRQPGLKLPILGSWA